ncbi:hypothetical protein [Mycolicibacterium sp.]|uniref:hypothetical protein n=1 Tax=Mycolicibacterium sp. TaxID=2320850 RepID=UPI001A24AE62|nr:hypothetical protein [Mycolicibacterium sp.]MBJ7401596.1 hypothetical protein [Mycolicibacterium sp.]
MTAPKPPPGLKARGRALWRDVQAAYRLNPAEAATLGALARTHDEIADLEAELAVAPLIVEGSKGQPVPNKLLAEIRAHRALADKLQISLALPAPGEQTGQRRSGQAKAAAEARWRKTRLTEVRKSG